MKVSELDVIGARVSLRVNLASFSNSEYSCLRYHHLANSMKHYSLHQLDFIHFIVLNKIKLNIHRNKEGNESLKILDEFSAKYFGFCRGVSKEGEHNRLPLSSFV
jgi:hypothetical protein